jgi:uncharacterized protein YpbB
MSVETNEAESEIRLAAPRDLDADESLRVRKILACAARMNGRFGKGLLVATLRGSRSQKVTQVGLDALSTYGILADMSAEEVTAYVDALITAGALRATGGAYPTVAITAIGGDVMRERATICLALPVARPRNLATQLARPSQTPQCSTVDETYKLYEQGLSVEDIARQRGMTEMTIEKHLADCIVANREIEIARFVTEDDYLLVAAEVARIGAERLRPLRDALPPHVTYRIIRFVVADLERRKTANAAGS